MILKKGGKMKDEDLIGKTRFNIGVMKPNIEYLMSGQNEDQEQGGDEVRQKRIDQSVKIPGPEVLDRYMAKSHFGKWYVQPDKWQQLQSEAVRDQNIDPHKIKKSPSPAKNRPTQVDWNRQTHILIKKSVPEKESTLSKMLN